VAETHEQPHLAIGDVAAGQGAVPHRREEPATYSAGRDRQTTRPFQGRAVRRIRNVSQATPSRRHASGDTFSSRLTRAPHPDCRAALSREIRRGGVKPPSHGAAASLAGSSRELPSGVCDVQILTGGSPASSTPVSIRFAKVRLRDVSRMAQLSHIRFPALVSEACDEASLAGVRARNRSLDSFTIVRACQRTAARRHSQDTGHRQPGEHVDS